MTVEELLAREEIRDKLYRYCRAVDRLDSSQNEGIFWDDAHFIGGPFPDDMPATQFLAIGLKDAVADVFALSSHSLSNIVMDFDGDVAHVESYALCYHHSHPTAEGRAKLIGAENDAAFGFSGDDIVEFELFLRYVDRWERRTGEWRIKHRRLVLNWSRLRKSTGISTGGLYDTLTVRAVRGAGDPAYFRD